MANTVNTHKDFPSLVNAIIDSRLDNLWTCIPAIVIDVDYAAHSCSIRPKMKINGSEMPILLQVPIMKANNSVIISLKRDDIVLALFSKYSLTELLKDRNPASTKTESRQFAIDDAIVIGGMFLSTDIIPPYSVDDIVLYHPSGSFIKFLANGNIEIKARYIDFTQL